MRTLVCLVILAAGCVKSTAAVVANTAKAAWNEGCDDPTELSPDAVAAVNGPCRAADRFLAPQASSGRSHFDGAWWNVFAGELALVKWRHPAPFSGPSHGELTLGGGYARTSEPMTRSSAFIDATTRISLEHTVARSWFIPYVGTSVGRTLSSDVPQSFYVAPIGGAHLLWYAGANGGLITVSAEAQYRVPFEAFDRLRGGSYLVHLSGSWW